METTITLVLTEINTNVIMVLMDIQKIVCELLETGLTEHQLAGLVPCAQSTINAYRNGERGARPSWAIAGRLASLHEKIVKRRRRKKPAAS